MWFNEKKEDTAPPVTSDNETAELLKRKEDAIVKLLEHLATQQVDIPDELRKALLGEEKAKQVDEEAGKQPNILSELLSSRATDLALLDEDELVKEIRVIQEKIWGDQRKKFECRVINGSFRVKIRTEKDLNFPRLSTPPPEEEPAPARATQHIETVASASPIAKIVGRCLKILCMKGNVMKEEEKVIMDDVNLRFEAGKMYLVLGLPGSGKSTLLKMVANTIRQDKNHIVGGEVTVNGMSTKDKTIYWTNVSNHIDQIDRLHPFLTVRETVKFAWNCRQGGSHLPYNLNSNADPDVLELVKILDEKKWTVAKTLDGLGLTSVKDTFVGDQTTVRGVSGGEKKRVTVAELAVARVPVACCDEISTGLDAATTYDIIKLMSTITKMSGGVKIVSLLQPPPETVALFDDLILVDSGLVIYAGPMDGTVRHFESLGYSLPERTDVADWLLTLPTKEGAKYLADENCQHLSAKDFKEKFDESEVAIQTRATIVAPLASEYKLNEKELVYFKTKYHNPWYRSLWLLVRREMLLWWRDKYQIRARFAQDLIMGIVAGTVFWQQSENPTSVMGIIFQSMFFLSVGAMLKIPAQFEPRSIFYKHQDANFFPTWTFVAGRSIAAFPTSMMDALVYGSFVYWFVGLSSSDGPVTYFKYLLLVLCSSLSSGLIFSMFSATVRDRSTAQACMSIAIVVMVLFSGFTVQPDVIPVYWLWVYWGNMFAWVLRSLIVNEYTSGKYDAEQENGLTYGETILSRFGFVDANGDTYTEEWVWWGFLFAVGSAFLSVVGSTVFLATLRFETGKSLLGADIPETVEDVDFYKPKEIEYDADTGQPVLVQPLSSPKQVEIPFPKVNLAFKDIHYFVKASTSNEELELLKGVDGYLEAGKMTALMGSSGAGKTTLMDCLSLRKTTGTITGEVTLNGHSQDSASFRRCTGYVEQFDVQSPALTIRETIDFSATLRLEETDPAVNAESIKKFVDQTLEMLELTVIQDLQVGSDSSGGLSFEQRKRLSIAVELVSNPSVLFLDEPTSGLDARAAGIVMRGLKRIALTGRAVCATIHQPSIAIFNEFDSLLLLKRGGEVVYFGELGDQSSTLISYLESFDATPKIKSGENPATWMLTCIGAGSASKGKYPFDYSGAYRKSKLRENALSKIAEFNSQMNDETRISFTSEFAASTKTQLKAVMGRILRIYWRSPSYNMVRLMVSAIVALLFGSVYASQRIPKNESDMNSRVTSIYITFLFLAVNSFNTVLVVFETERNMYYRHKAALMYKTSTVLKALSVAEIPFILVASMVFCACFYFLVGFSTIPYKFFLYYLFFTLNLCAFTFLGQMMVSLVRDSQTAQGFGGLLIAMTSIFAGVLIRPNNINGFWTFAYWLFPGHYILEGLVSSQFHEDSTPIEATLGSPFYQFLVSERGCNSGECIGTAEDWVFVSFGGQFSFANIPWNILYLGGLIIAARLITFVALAKLNYLSK